MLKIKISLSFSAVSRAKAGGYLYAIHYAELKVIYPSLSTAISIIFILLIPFKVRIVTVFPSYVTNVLPPPPFFIYHSILFMEHLTFYLQFLFSKKLSYFCTDNTKDDENHIPRQKRQQELHSEIDHPAPLLPEWRL